MTRAEDSEFSVPLQGPENKSQFFDFAVALNVGMAEKNRITLRLEEPVADGRLPDVFVPYNKSDKAYFRACQWIVYKFWMNATFCTLNYDQLIRYLINEGAGLYELRIGVRVTNWWRSAVLGKRSASRSSTSLCKPGQSTL